MDQAQLTEQFCERPQNFSWLIGAGTSRSAGLPTASDVLWIMKRQYYSAEENQEISRQDIQSDAVRARIQSFMLARGFPEEWAEDEYPKYFLKIFGEDRERQRKYIKALLSEDNVKLTVGHRALGALVAMKLCRIIFSTNFDSVVEKAVAEVSGQSLSAYSLEGSHNALRALNNEEYPILCKLHGDFRYDSLKNLPSDLTAQNAELSACLVAAANRFGFIVCGYSGRDDTVMQLLRTAVGQPNAFPHGLFWTYVGPGGLSPRVAAFLGDARAKGVNAQAIHIETFDSLMSRIWRRTDNKPNEMQARVHKTRLSTVSIPLPNVGRANPILRTNGLLITELPSHCQELVFNAPMEWRELRQAQRDAETSIVFTKGEAIWCWGSEGDIKTTFGAKLTSVRACTLPMEIDLAQNLHIKSLLEDALSIALARDKPLLARSGRYASTLIVDRNAADVGALDPLFQVVGKTSGLIPGVTTEETDEHPTPDKVYWAECLQLSVEYKNGATWLLLDPDIWIWPTRARKIAVSFLDRRRSDRYNNKLNNILDAWIEILFGEKGRNSERIFTTFSGEPSAANPAFKIGSRTGYAKKISS